MAIKRTAADLNQVVRIANRTLRSIAAKAGFEDPGEVLELDKSNGDCRIQMSGGGVDLSPRGTINEITIWMEGYLEGLERMETFIVRITPAGAPARLERNARRNGRFGNGLDAPTNRQIRALLTEAQSAGDDYMCHVCWVALGEREPLMTTWPSTADEARTECAYMLSDAAAQDEEDD